VIVRALEWLRQGVCGDVLGVDFYRTSDYPPYAGGKLPATFRHGGYPFQDMGVHALSLMEAFLGRIDDVDVRFRSTNNDPHVFFDEWRGTVACAKGSGAFFLSWSARPIRNELFVHGTRGDMHIDCFLQTCTVRKSLPGPKPIAAGINAMTQAAGTMWHVPKLAWRLASGALAPSPGIHAGVLQFHEALARLDAPPVTMDEGRRMVAWLEPFCLAADADRDRALGVGAPLAPCRILVTGASGVLGRALLNRLVRRGESVRVLVRRRSSDLEQLPGVQVVYGELGDPERVDRAVAGVQLVYHVGATMRGRSWADFEAGTVCGTSNVVRSCLKHDVERLVHVSSLSVLDYAAQSSQAVVDESSPLEPFLQQRGSYTRAKALAEAIVIDAVRRHGLRTVVVRPGQIFGPGYEHVAPYGAIALAGRWIAVGAGRLKLPLVHVDDVVEGLLAAAARSDVGGSIFHLVDSTPVTQRDYIAWSRENASRAIRVHYVPRPALLLAGAVLDLVGGVFGRTLGLSRYRIRSIKELTFDCSAARNRLGWEPRHRFSSRSSRVLDLLPELPDLPVESSTQASSALGHSASQYRTMG
jgi:nucleoside-diphosphate-sugar epimerase